MRNIRKLKKMLWVVLLVFAAAAPASCFAAVDPSLIGWWKFDDGEGEIAKDNSGNNNDAKICGATWAEGKQGKCLSFDGKGNYAEAPASVSKNLTADFTIEAWVKVNKIETAAFVVSGMKYYLRFDDIRKMQAGLCATSNKYEGVCAVPYFNKYGQWTHVAAVYNKKEGKISLYEDGIRLEASPKESGSHDLIKDSSPCFIGAHNKTSLFFNGLIDEVKVYNRALSDKEIMRHYEGVSLVYDSAYLKDVLLPQYEAKRTKTAAALKEIQAGFNKLEADAENIFKANQAGNTAADKEVLENCQKMEAIIENIEQINLGLTYTSLLQSGKE